MTPDEAILFLFIYAYLSRVEMEDLTRLTFALYLTVYLVNIVGTGVDKHPWRDALGIDGSSSIPDRMLTNGGDRKITTPKSFSALE